MNLNLFFIRALIYKEEALAKTVQCIYTADFKVMHRCLAHPSKDMLQKARKHVKEFREISIPEGAHVCPGCAQGKMTKKTFPPSESRETMPFALIHSDLKSFPIDSYHKYKYAIIFLGDATSHAWTMNLCSKDATITATKQFLAMVKNKYKTTVGKWMSDAGGEYKSDAFIKMIKDEGIEILQSIAHTHQQNESAEGIIRTLMEKGESMRSEACLPQPWWEFSLKRATHVYNRTPICCLSWQTPHKQLNREKPTVNHLWVFGCVAYTYISAEVRSNKLAPKSELMTYLGNAPGGKGWHFIRAPNNLIFTSAHAIFDKTLFPKCPLTVRQPNTRVHTPALEPSRALCSDEPSTCRKDHHCHCPPKVDEDEDFSPESQPPPKTGEGTQRERAPTPPPSCPPTTPPQSLTLPSESEIEREEEKEEEPWPPRQPTPGPSLRRSSHQPKPRFDKDSIYGKKTGAQVGQMSKKE